MQRRARARRSRSSCRWYCSGVLFLESRRWRGGAWPWPRRRRAPRGPPRASSARRRGAARPTAKPKLTGTPSTRSGEHRADSGRARARRARAAKPPRRESKRPRSREAAARQRTPSTTTRKTLQKNTGRPLNKSACESGLGGLVISPTREPRRASTTWLRELVGRLGRAQARPSDRRREPERRGGTTREGRLLTGSDAGATLGPPPEHERIYI